MVHIRFIFTPYYSSIIASSIFFFKSCYTCPLSSSPSRELGPTGCNVTEILVGCTHTAYLCPSLFIYYSIFYSSIWASIIRMLLEQSPPNLATALPPSPPSRELGPQGCNVTEILVSCTQTAYLYPLLFIYYSI